MTSRKKVLILDDSPLVLAAAKAAFARAGLDALTAEDLAELDRRLAEDPDVLVIDINMPEVYGDDVAAVLRDVRGVKLPIVLFSSLDEEELARRAAAAGIDAYISKNAGIAKLVERVTAMLADASK